MAGIVAMIGGALVNSLAFSGSNYMFTSYQITVLMKGRDTMKRLKNYKKIEIVGLRKDNKDWILSINNYNVKGMQNTHLAKLMMLWTPII